MSQQTHDGRPCGHTIQAFPDLYIIISYQPRKDEPNYARAACEFLEPDNPEKGNGLAVYLSLFDAHIAAALMSNSTGQQYHAIHITEFDPSELIADNEGKFHIFLQYGWVAANGKFVANCNGTLARFTGQDTLTSPATGINSINIKINEADIENYNHMREIAGLFAHTECYNQVHSLTERERMQHVALALTSMQHPVVSDCEINQLAIYDFEGTQWHFVPISPFLNKEDKEE